MKNVNGLIRKAYTTAMMYDEVVRLVSFVSSSEGLVSARENQIVSAIQQAFLIEKTNIKTNNFLIVKITIFGNIVTVSTSDDSEKTWRCIFCEELK